MPPVCLLPFDPGRDLKRVGAWLRQPEVERWWGPADVAQAAVAGHDPHDSALIAADGEPVGYLAWQVPTRQELLDAGLADLPADLVDIDILVGEPAAMGRGTGAQALAGLAGIGQTPSRRLLLLARVHRRGAGLQPEIEVHGVIHGVARRRVRRGHVLEDVEVHLAAV